MNRRSFLTGIGKTVTAGFVYRLTTYLPRLANSRWTRPPWPTPWPSRADKDAQAEWRYVYREQEIGGERFYVGFWTRGAPVRVIITRPHGMIAHIDAPLYDYK